MNTSGLLQSKREMNHGIPSTLHDIIYFRILQFHRFYLN